jgi:tripartite-type tricarboxylate transporter receptor subunit TctC
MRNIFPRPHPSPGGRRAFPPSPPGRGNEGEGGFSPTDSRCVNVVGLLKLASAEIAKLFLVAGAFLTSSVGVAAESPYPTKPIRFIIPFAPGGGNDIIARMLGQKLAEAWGQQVVIDNRPGAGGNIAAEITARAAPDGYTVFQFNVANTIAVSVYKNLGYDPVKDFAAVTQLATAPFILVINSALSAATVQEFVAYAKARPARLNYASSGNGGSTHLVTELFKTMAGIEATHIPYGGAAPGLTDVMGGQVQFMFAVPATALPLVRSGKLRALGVSSLHRSPLAPDLPTVAESGVAGFEGSTWYGIVVASRTSPAIVRKLNVDIVRALQRADVRERLAGQGVELVGNTPEEFTRFISSEIAKWGRVARISGAVVE